MVKKGGVPKRNSLSRKRVPKRYKEYILIVTEGTKTEPYYFNELRKSERITTSKIIITPSDYGTDPLSIVDYALELKKKNLKENRKTGEPKYDLIYCVIDRDDHDNFFEAFLKANSNKICFIRSIPCFEIWYLLHFLYTTRDFDSRPELYKELKKYLKNYDKNKALYSTLKDKLNLAIENSIRLKEFQSGLCDVHREHPNPLTEVQELVSKLLELK